MSYMQGCRVSSTGEDGSDFTHSAFNQLAHSNNSSYQQLSTERAIIKLKCHNKEIFKIFSIHWSSLLLNLPKGVYLKCVCVYIFIFIDTQVPMYLEMLHNCTSPKMLLLPFCY